MASKAETLTAAVAGVQDREQIFDIFRRWGYLQATLDPLGQYLPPEPFPIATTPEGDIAAEARAYYCGNFAIEFMHIPNLEQRQWLQDQIERSAPKQDQAHILTQLIRADLFEQVIQQRYLGTKRFSLEGLTVLIPFLDQVFATASPAGVTRSIIAMAHRGRLNVMTNTSAALLPTSLQSSKTSTRAASLAAVMSNTTPVPPVSTPLPPATSSRFTSRPTPAISKLLILS